MRRNKYGNVDFGSYKSILSDLFGDCARFETGHTLIGYAILLRINRAKILLTKTDKSITQIAAECGYDDFTYFSRQFKKSTNMTPRDYRKEYADHGEAEE